MASRSGRTLALGLGLAVAAGVLLTISVTTSKPLPNIVIITVESRRTDHLCCARLKSVGYMRD